MNELIDGAWRVYPTAALIALGLVMAVRGFGGEIVAFRRAPGDPGTPLAMIRAVRRGIVGLAIAGLAAAWLCQLAWLAVLSGIIAGEELLESSFAVFGLTRGPKLRLRG